MNKTKITRLLLLSFMIFSTFFAFTGCQSSSEKTTASYLCTINNDYSNTYDVVTKYLKEVDGIDATPATNEIIYDINNPNSFKLQYKLNDELGTIFSVTVKKDTNFIFHSIKTDYLSNHCSKEINELAKQYLPKGSQVFAEVSSYESYDSLKSQNVHLKSIEEIVDSNIYTNLESVLISIPVLDKNTDLKQYEENIKNLTQVINKKFDREDSYLHIHLIITTEDDLLDKASNALNIYSKKELIQTIDKDYLKKNIKSAHLLNDAKREVFSSIIGYSKHSITTDKNSESYLKFDIDHYMDKY